MKHQALNALLATAFVIALLTALLFGSFKLIIYSPSFINNTLRKLDFASSIGMSEEDLEKGYDAILSYCAGKRPDMVVYGTVNGQERELFNEQEKLHMADCKKLFDVGFAMLYISMAVLVALLVAVIAAKDKKRILFAYANAVLIGNGTFFCLAGLLILLISQDFNKYFVLFHEIFFDNDLWQMDPRTCLMINMMPEEFFFEAAFAVFLIFFISCLVCVGASLGYKIYIKKQKQSNAISTH